MHNLHIQLEPRSIGTCVGEKLPAQLRRAFERGVLQHQEELYVAAANNDIVLDLAPTGTGKTNAGLSVLNHNAKSNAVYIAPTNALIAQQTEAAQAFVTAARLPHIVKAASAKHVKAWTDERVGDRSGEKLYNALREPTTLFPECRGGRPLLLVTNPDIFYYATFFAYQRLDRDNIASAFYSSFSTVIFDEFHLYSAKQLVSLLFYLALSKVFGYFEQNRKVVLLTATPEPACEAALDVLKSAGCRIQSIDGTSDKQASATPSQTAVDLTLCPYPDKAALIAQITDEVIRRVTDEPDQYGAVILDSKDAIGRLSDQLRAAGYGDRIGRITGDTPKEQRHTAAQKQVILATSTVDVGFNFEREQAPERQNLDWLIFSARDRFSFWQRMGRVGRVLGKAITEVTSEAIAFLPEQAWEEGIAALDTAGGRAALSAQLAAIDCLKRPFLDIYWRSEAFLEMAKPLLELEDSLKGLPQAGLVNELYEVLRSLFQGKRDWSFYRWRMQTLKEAERIARESPETIQQDWQFIKGRRYCLESYVKACMPEDYEALCSKQLTISEIETELKEDITLAEDLKDYAEVLQASYAPIFKFRDSLFDSVTVQDPNRLLIDESGEVIVDPIHLLRFYEFASDGEKIVATDRAEEPYTLSFALSVDDLEEFKNNYLCRLLAFRGCTIVRSLGGATRSTAFIEKMDQQMIPGVVVKESDSNRWAIVKLRRLGLEAYPMQVSALNTPETADYTFFPSLNGILAIATAGIRLKSPDNEEFWIA